MPGEDKKIANMHTIKPERKDNFDNFNKAEYDQKLAAKEQQYNDCLEYIDRLQKEIKRYQSIVPLEALDTRVATTDLIDEIPSHKESMGEYLEFILHNPLMQAYEQNVLSLEKEVENKEESYQNLKMDFEKSMEENEQLREMLVHKTKELNRVIDGQGTIPMANESDRDRARRLGGTSEEMLRLIETMKNDQEALIDQIESLKIRNENLEKFAEEKENRFHELQSTAEEANNQYFKMKQEFDKLKHLYDSVNNEFSILEAKLEKETRDKDELLFKNKKIDNEINQMNKHLEHLKTSYNELSDNKSTEIDALSRELSDWDLREREFKGKIEILEKSKFDIEEELRLAKRDLASTKSDCNNMLKIMEDYETEIELHKKKSKQLDVLAEDYKKRTEEAQMEKDWYSLKEQQFLSKISKLEEDNRYDAREREDKFNSLLENLRTKQKLVLDERENEINDLNKKYSESSTQSEKLKTDNDRLRADVVKLEKALLDFQQELNKKCDDYERKLRDAIAESRGEAQRRLENDNSQLKSENESLHYENNLRGNTIRELESKWNVFQIDYEKMLEENRRIKESLKYATELKDRAEIEAERLKQLYNTKMQEVSLKLEKRAEAEKARINSLDINKDQQFKTIKNLEHLIDKYKDEHKSTVAYFTKLVLHLNTENQRYKDDNFELKKEIRRSGIVNQPPERQKTSKDKSKDRGK